MMKFISTNHDCWVKDTEVTNGLWPDGKSTAPSVGRCPVAMIDILIGATETTCQLWLVDTMQQRLTLVQMLIFS